MEKVVTIYSANTIEEVQEITAILEENGIAYKIKTNENMNPILGVNVTNSVEKMLYKFSIEVGADDVERAQELIMHNFGDEKEAASAPAIKEEDYESVKGPQQCNDGYTDSPMGRPLKISIGILIALYVCVQTFCIVKVAHLVHSYSELLAQAYTSNKYTSDDSWSNDSDTSQNYSDSDDSDYSDDYSYEEADDYSGDDGDYYNDDANSNDEENNGNEETTSDNDYNSY